jgi:hypothetical protein
VNDFTPCSNGGICRTGTCVVYKVTFTAHDTVVPIYKHQWDSTAFLTTDTFDRNRMKWSITTLEGDNATIQQTGRVSFGTGAGRYVVRAESLDLPSAHDEFNLTVVDWVLGAHSSKGPGADFTDGHAWITVTDFSQYPGKVTSFGLWPDGHALVIAEGLNNGSDSDVRINLEELRYPGKVGVYNTYLFLNPTQKDDLAFYIYTPREWTTTFTCASWASEAVFNATGINISATDFVVFGTPRAFGTSINTLESSRPSAALNPILGGRTSSFDGSPQKP